MGHRIVETDFHCHDDCRQSGCPGHKMKMDIQTVSDSISLSIDGENWFWADPERIKTLIHLASQADYNLIPDLKESPRGK